MSFFPGNDAAYGRSIIERPKAVKKHSSLCRLEIRPDSSYIIFRGSPYRTSSQKLKGRVVLMNSEPLDVKSIAIELIGRWTTSYPVKIKDIEGGLPTYPLVLRTFGSFLDESSQLVTTPTRLPPSNHVFEFEFDLPGHVHESIEGGSETKPNMQIYRLRATIKRKFPHKELRETKAIRIIRTIDPDAYALFDPLSVSGFWPDKIKYEWSSISKAIVFGDKVTVDFKLTPLLEKLELGKVRFWIREIMQVTADPSPSDFEALREIYGTLWRTEYGTAEQEQDCPPQSEEILDDELLIPTRKFSLTFELPKSLRECRQSVHYGEFIQIKHALHISVALHNPDGHISELRAFTPITLYISPHLPIGENQEVTAPLAGFSNPSVTGSGPAFPPTYEEHVQDMPMNPDMPINPFSGISSSGFVTPSAPSRESRSGTATPLRTTAMEGGSETQQSSNAHHPLPEELLHRLQTLQSQSEESNREHRQPSTASSGHPGDDVEHIEYNMDELCRVPTYNTAVNNPGPTTFGAAPPSYATATHRRTSPQLLAPPTDQRRRDRGTGP